MGYAMKPIHPIKTPEDSAHYQQKHTVAPIIHKISKLMRQVLKQDKTEPMNLKDYKIHHKDGAF